MGEVETESRDHLENIHEFCLVSVATKMQKLTESENSADVDLLTFIMVYEELCKFIKMLGKIFEFVEKDVREKILTLRSLLKSDPVSYKTIDSMVNSEKPSRVRSKNSGSVAILILNRALEFIVDFMNAAAQSTNEDSIPKICKECYDDTLAKHHPWIIRTAVKVAVYTLPSREKMLYYIKGSLDQESEVREQIERVVKNGRIVHKRINSIYTTHDLLKIA